VLKSIALAAILLCGAESHAQMRSDNDRQTMAGSGDTALMLAVANDHVETVRLLLERGADVHVRNAQGRTALDLARERGYAEIAALIENSLRDRSSAKTQEDKQRVGRQLNGLRLEQLLADVREVRQQPDDQGKSYTVQAGDTAKRIASANGCSLRTFQLANPDVDFAHLRVGQSLHIPGTTIGGAVSGGEEDATVAALTDALIEAKNKELPTLLVKSTVEQRVTLLTLVEKRMAQANTRIGALNSEAEGAIRQGRESEAAARRKQVATLQTYLGVLQSIRELLNQS